MIITLAWTLLAAGVVVTFCPIQFRPRVTDPQLERYLTWMLIAAAFTLAYPKRPALSGALCIGAAVASEVAQLIDPGRHATVDGGVAKALGAAIGTAFGIAVARTQARVSLAQELPDGRWLRETRAPARADNHKEDAKRTTEGRL